jgi:L-lactate dehydrogenase complex protein LldF
MTETMARIDFRESTRRVSPNVTNAVQRATSSFLVSRAARAAEMPQWEELRRAAHDLRMHALDHLGDLIAQVEERVSAAGGHVHHARDAQAARQIVLDLARQYNVRTAVKSKSMATEEIALNRTLEQNGIRAVETDLGEYIIQLAGVGPSHIIAPAIYLTKEGIADLFAEKLGIAVKPEPRELADIASRKLREEFLSAEMGITGANFVVAENGTVVLVSNEGNARMVTTLPQVHVAVAGIDKIVPDWDGLTVLLKLLARSATGQKLSAYTSFITGPRSSDSEMGAREFHLVLLDNGRSRIRRDPDARETLLCIRCGACLNVCPVYNQVGGHAYGGVYSGPIGAILSPQLLGMGIARDLPYASSLCGACADVCPVKIPIPKILLYLRRRVAEGDAQEGARSPRVLRIVTRLMSSAMRVPRLYRSSAAVMRILQAPFRREEFLWKLPPPLDRWTNTRALPAFQKGFRDWAKRNLGKAVSEPRAAIQSRSPKLYERASKSVAPRTPLGESAEIDLFMSEVNALKGKARRIRAEGIEDALSELVEMEHVQAAVSAQTESILRWQIRQTLTARGVELIPPSASKREMARADLGITEADYVLPETGTLGLLSSDEQPRGISLLPRVHLALVRASALRADLHHVFAQAKAHKYLVFITGPSRTADIELTLTLGVHGPRALYVWVVEH